MINKFSFSLLFFLSFFSCYNISFANETCLSICDYTLAPKKSQTIEMSPIGDLPFSSFPYTIDAISSSGLPLKYEIIYGPAFVLPRSNILVGRDTGEVKIKIIQEGNHEYEAAYLYDTFRIVKSVQSIDFLDIQDKVYGDPSFELKAVSSSRLPILFEVINDSPASIEGNVLTINGGGRVSVLAEIHETEKYQACSIIKSFNVLKADQTILFDKISDKKYGDAAFKMYARSSVDLDVVFEVFKGNATIYHDILSVEGAGDVYVKAIQKGNANYKTVETLNVFNVSKANQTINFSKVYDKIYGCDNFNINAETTSDLHINYEIEEGNVEFIGDNTLKVNGAGLVTINATQSGNLNYNVCEQAYSFVISKKEQKLSFTEISQKKYDEIFSVNASVDSGLPLVYDILSGPATVTGNLISTTGIGVVQFRISQKGNVDYNPLSVTKNFAIVRENQTLSCSINDKVFSEKPFSVKATSDTGLKVDIEIFSGPCEFKEGKFVLTGSGEVSLKIIQKGNDTYRYVSKFVNFYVEKAEQEIYFGNDEKFILNQKYNLKLNSSISGHKLNLEVLNGSADLNGMYITPLSVSDIVLRIEYEGDEKYNSVETIKTYPVFMPLGIIDDINANVSVIVYPNPASDFVYLDFSDNQIYTVDIFSSIGEKLYSEDMQLTGNIDIRSFASGIYFIKGRSVTNNFSVKLLVKK